MKIGDAVIAVKEVKCINKNSPEFGRVIRKGFIDFIITINPEGTGLGLQSDLDPAGWFWNKYNFKVLASESEVEEAIEQLEVFILA